MVVVIELVVLGMAGFAEQRSGVGPCRQGVLALIGMLDDGDTKSADYGPARAGVVPDLRACRKNKARHRNRQERRSAQKAGQS